MFMQVLTSFFLFNCRKQVNITSIAECFKVFLSLYSEFILHILIRAPSCSCLFTLLLFGFLFHISILILVIVLKIFAAIAR